MLVLRRVSSGVFAHLPARHPEWIMAFALLRWGMITVAPGDVFQQSPAWQHLLSITSETVWGWTAIAVASARILALVINGTFVDTWWGRWSPHVRSIFSILSCQIWVQIYISLSVSGTASTGTAMYSAAAITCGFSAYRAALEARIVDRAGKPT